jgi:hypothetical protein
MWHRMRGANVAPCKALSGADPVRPPQASTGACDPTILGRRMASVHRRIRPWRASNLYRQRPTPQQLAAGATLREQLIADRGGPDVVSTAESMLIDLIVAAKVKHADAHNYLVQLPRPWANRKSHAVWRVVLDAAYLERHLARLLMALGLERRAEAVETLTDYVARKDAEHATGETTAAPVPVEDEPSGED